MSIGTWRFRYPYWLLVFLLLLGGCTTVADMRPRGPVSFKEGALVLAPYDEVFQAAREVLRDLGLRIQEINWEGHYIIADRGFNFWSFGENVGVYFLPEANKTRVLVISKKKYALSEWAKDFTHDVYRGLSLKLR